MHLKKQEAPPRRALSVEILSAAAQLYEQVSAAADRLARPQHAVHRCRRSVW